MFEPIAEESALRRAIADAAEEVVLVSTDRDGVITSWNAAAERLYGYGEAEMVGGSFSVLVPPEYAEEERELRQRALRGETVRDVNTHRRRADGTTAAVAVSVRPILGRDGGVVGLLQVARDRRDRELAERASRRLAAIVESSDDAIVSKDLNGIVTSWNRAAELMFGYRADEMIGSSIRKIIPNDLQHEEDHVLARIRAGEPVDHFETVRQRKNGSLINVSLSVSPIRDSEGRIIGASKIARDISERKRDESEREKLSQVGSIVSATLDRTTIVQAVTDIATELTEAQFGAFFYNVVDDRGESYQLYTLSGVPRSAFEGFPMPRNTEVFAPTFVGAAIVRSDDITADPRYGKNPPHHGMPRGHLPVRSYLAVPVKAPSGEVFGGLFFGHERPAQFNERHERLARGVATWASVALENARLYVSVQEANRLKDEFLATLSHELRTPLNAILGYSRMMRMGILAPPKQARAIETIERNATSLTQIVEDVLDVSRIVSGKMRLNMQPIDLIAVVRQSIDAVRPTADAKHITIATTFDVTALPMTGDPDRLQQVLWNIMSNAVKFTGPNGRIRVMLTRSDTSIDVAVQDSGVGIPPAFLAHVFERFRQAESGTNRERGGLGLGLSIARELVHMHGGTIKAESEGPGCGATFRISLPTTVTRLEHATADAAHGGGHTEPRAVVADLNGVRVLAVDDDPDALSLVREILENAGAQVEVANSGPEALDVLNRTQPDVLVSDIAMPRMDGFQLIATVRNHKDTAIRDIPAAALTAYARSEDSARARRSGFQMHLPKPIDPVDLTEAIASLVRR